MLMPSSISISYAPLVPLWNQVNVIVHLVEGTTRQMQHATLLSAGRIASMRGMHKMQARSEHSRPRWSVMERLPLIASVLREGTTDNSDLITLMSATPILLRCLVTGSLHGEIQLCQE